jgi:lipid A ethanolaminephosphotransferase
MKISRPEVPALLIACITLVYLAVFCNLTFWGKVLAYFEAEPMRLLAFGVLITGMFGASILGLSFRYLFKPAHVVLIFIAVAVNYFTDTFGITISKVMVHNVLETDLQEASDILVPSFWIYMGTWALIPSLALCYVKLTRPQFWRELFRGFAIAGVLLLSAGLALWINFAAMYKASDLMGDLNPFAAIGATVRALEADLSIDDREVAQIGLDAIVKPAGQPVTLVVIVGETARAQSFSLNGYSKLTNPRLERMNVVNFSNVSSCGTSTTVSLPCMFSHYSRADYSRKVVHRTENVLDVAQRAGVSVKWYENNSTSKGVNSRVPYFWVNNKGKNSSVVKTGIALTRSC